MLTFFSPDLLPPPTTSVVDFPYLIIPIKQTMIPIANPYHIKYVRHYLMKHSAYVTKLTFFIGLFKALSNIIFNAPSEAAGD